MQLRAGPRANSRRDLLLIDGCTCGAGGGCIAIKSVRNRDSRRLTSSRISSSSAK
jgi:hypothetical protein